MESDELIGMYKESWDLFLEAYKRNLTQHEALKTLTEHCIVLLEDKELKDDAEKVKIKLREALEKGT